VQDTNGMLERKETEHGEGGRDTTRRTGMPVKKWKDCEQKEDG
jgi:hypothetical protein